MTPAHEDARAAAPNAKAMIEHIARALVDAPQSVLVDQFNDQGEMCWSSRSHPPTWVR